MKTLAILFLIGAAYVGGYGYGRWYAKPAAAATERKPAASSVKQMVFEEQKIEGKIRRPQLVLIKADQRPDFGPMVLQGRGKTKNLAATVARDLVEDASFNSAFRFEGTAIVTPAP